MVIIIFYLDIIFFFAYNDSQLLFKFILKTKKEV
jgi:hypothetical protein